MQNGSVLEVCVESVDLAIAAERGGAHRIELCADLALEGTTPSAGLMATARRHLKIPIFAMIRPRAGDFFYSDREIETMEQDIQSAKEIGLDGIVLGVLDQNQHVDVQRTRHLVNLAHPLPVTFHRAFELCPDWQAALDAVIQTGARRILTSGNESRATDSLPFLRDLVKAAGDRVTILVGGGVRAENAQRILQETWATEIHTSLGIKQGGPSRLTADSRIEVESSSEFERRAREICEIIGNVVR